MKHAPKVTHFCKGCNETKSAESFYFRKARNTLYSLCKSCVGVNRLRYKQANFEAHKARLRKSNLKKKFNITIEQYNNMFDLQQGACAICNTHQSKLTKTLAVDHCHATGKIRGLLCLQCNVALGNLKDSEELLKTAINYLKGNK